MAFPSIKELGGNVVVEAMARGVVPIIVRYGGPSDVVDEGCGVTLALKNEADTVQDLKQVLAELVDNRDRIRELGTAAYLKAGSTCTWEKKTEVLAAVMNYAMGSGPRPSLAPKQELLSKYDSMAIQ